MALDTRAERASATGVALPWRTTLPAPDGTIDAADRAHVAGLYAMGAAAPAGSWPPITINGYDPSLHGFRFGYITRTPAIDGHLSAPGRTLARVKVPGRPGEQVTRSEEDPHEMTVRGFVEAQDNDPAVARENWSKVYWIIRSQDPAKLIFSDRPDRYVLGEYTGPAEVALLGTGTLVQHTLPVAIPFLLADPRWLATTVTIVANVQTTAVALPQGDADVWPQVRIAGTSGTVILLELLNSATQVVASMEITLATGLGSGEYLVIDMDRYTIHRNSTGAFGEGTRLLDARTAGDWFRVRSIDADPLTGTPPSARCSSGTAEFHYRKAWRV